MDHKGISCAFIVAAKELKIKLTKPTVEKSLATLLEAYYSWHITYPTAYKNLMGYIDAQVLA